jgi:16S rRNA (cytosine967-C5)-methyltransferase
VLNALRSAAEAVGGVIAGRNLSVALEAAEEQSGYQTPERAATRALAFGTLRHLGFLRFAVARLTPRTPKDVRLRALLYVAIHQLEYSKQAPYAIVDQAVECAGLLAGAAKKPFVNAVLRSYQRRVHEIRAAAALDPEAHWSHPRWWIERLQSELGEAARSVLELANRHPPMTLRVNRRRLSVDSYLAQLRAAGMPAAVIGPSAVRLVQPVPVAMLPGFDRGEVSVQDAGAQRAAPLLDVVDGMRVLDACAAPGGKTAHLLELADLRLLALERDPLRAARVEQNLNRLGLGARVQVADAAQLDEWWDDVVFDRVLLDAPCSASGVVRRHPDARWLRRPSDIATVAREQKRLLDALWQVVRPGGKLLYVTCSIFREENQTQIEGFLARHPEARLLPLGPGESALLLPTEEHDGFYHALVEKT